MPDDREVQVRANDGREEEIIRAIHATKSYVGAAFITLGLYYIGFYLIGLIANIIFLGQANETMKITGDNPSGRGCLLILIWVHLVIPIIFILLFFTIGFGGIFSFSL